MVSLIVAMDSERGIGKANSLMWRLPADMAFFKKTTLHKNIIMGRRTYDSLPPSFKPLPDRKNIVITSNESLYSSDGVLTYDSLTAALEYFEDAIVIGGGQLYAEALRYDLIDEMFITKVDGIFGADVFFPNFNEDAWEKELLSTQEVDLKHSNNFSIWHYKRKECGNI